VAQLKEKIAALQNGFKAAYVRGNQLCGSLETSPRNEMDGALLEAINMGVIDDPALVNSTISRMKTLLMPTGGYRRVTGDSWYDSQEFILMNFNLARALMRQGRQAEADAIVARMVEKSKADSNTIPELYHTSDGESHRDTPGAPAGARPMAGYGAGAYMLYLAERQQISGQSASNCPAPAKSPA
jgi:GH15 family glucan-1,4-alpha-glucosidase